ncbi:uncharacterized protein LOC133862560 [Alnus glutinosa]|uniref:uncharacterized protein LOC133862560 n=1 Tax=Alnus glutinosa TaxID=3517 RepID=UPI002D780340|nr:uncharacterized protein LOC133862560 [Alnus glutinosa]
MEKSPRYSRASQPSSSASLNKSRSGYEPSDTENDWHESPWHESNDKNGALGSEGLKNMMPRNTSPMKLSRRHSSRFEYEVSSPAKASVASPARWKHSSTKSPHKPTRDNGKALSPAPGFDFRRNISPLSRAELQRQKSPYKPGVEEHNLDKNGFVGSSRKQNRRTPTREGTGAHPQLLEVNRVSEKTHHRRRSATAPRARGREEDPKNDYGHMLQREERNPSPLSKATSIGELNEMIAKAKLSSDHKGNAPIIDSTGSFSPGDIFFSRDHRVLALQKNVLPKNNGFERHLISPKPNILSARNATARLRLRATDNFDHNARDTSSRNGLSQTTMTSSSAISGKNSGKLSDKSSKMSDSSGRTSGSMQKFTDNRRKSQTDAWFACIRMGSCRKSKSPEHRAVDEASFIEKAFVVENLTQFWGDKHQPGSLNGFTCHKQEAQLLQQIVSYFRMANSFLL